uniref:Uncharacterized protein n=1 Tax=uncultured marine group II/III euryarchaeote AD1000_45_F09 TaxID=1457776 RepID=A0A075FXY6_9EURY|nr:hypothetical protein [uncultured marine group II/III euryarchaeote AD1000_45_F09]
MAVAVLMASSRSDTGLPEPSATGKPDLTMASRAASLSPSNLSTSGLGPMNLMPSSFSLSAKVGFSARNP